MADLSILIPARNEEFLSRTIADILEHSEGDTEVIAVLDGAWADPPIEDDSRVHLIYHSEPIGQRAATNEAARMSAARFIMKVDAHCAFDQGFDIKLMAECEPDWTVIPRMYNLHVFDWECLGCGRRTYQGPRPEICEDCQAGEFERVMVWEPRWNRKTDFARFDSDLRFAYWGAYGKRPEAQGEIADVMASVGACFFMTRDRFWELGGLDENHGSWGQVGVEVACKAWLSGGRQVVNKRTWFAHLFRTQKGFMFPYPQSGSQVEHARRYSRELWTGNQWAGQRRPLSWLIEKFAPVPTWDGLPEDGDFQAPDPDPIPVQVSSSGPVDREPEEIQPAARGLVYYTDNRINPGIMGAVQNRLNDIAQDLGAPIVSVSLAPIGFGSNLVLEGERRGILTMFRQILSGLEEIQAEVVYLVEHDVIYHPSHFDLMPASPWIYYYNENTWKVDAESGQAVFFYTKQTSGLIAYRSLLLEHYRRRVARVEAEGFSRRMGFEPGCHRFPRGVDNWPAERLMSQVPNLDIRHDKNLTANRWDRSEFRGGEKVTEGWTLADEVPGWGRTKGRIREILEGIYKHGES